MSLVYKSYFAIKLSISILLLSFAFLFLYNLSSGFSQPSDTILNNTSSSNNISSPIAGSSNSQVNKDEIHQVNTTHFLSSAF